MKLQTFSLRKTAKLLRFNGGLIKFINWLKDEKFLMEDSEPYQEFLDRDYFTYSFKRIKVANKTVCVTRVTIKGLYAIKRRLDKTK